jgi:hypothetical protein
MGAVESVGDAGHDAATSCAGVPARLLDQRPAVPFNLADQEGFAVLGRPHQVIEEDEVHPMFVALAVHAGKRTLSTRQSTIHWSARCMIPLDESICVVLLDESI